MSGETVASMFESASDATLLERFVIGHEEAAFSALVRRHGPRVARLCRQILSDEHEAEDVFQATFLLLSRRAAGIPWRPSVRPWIDGVARRLALHARSGASRRRARETCVASLVAGGGETSGRLPERLHPLVEAGDEIDRRDLRGVLDDELLRLPEKYRAPLVLCDLEGHTHEEAARRLGWPTGSMSRRLDRGRQILRLRLTHRGVGLALVGLVSLAAAAAVLPRPPELSASARLAAHPAPDEARGLEALLSAAKGEPGPRDLAAIRTAARQAVESARKLQGGHSGARAAVWDGYAADMARSAREVESSSLESDDRSLALAARRLEASCLQCHAAFRRPAGSPGVSLEPRVAPPAAPGSGPRRTAGAGTARPPVFDPAAVLSAGASRATGGVEIVRLDRPAPHPNDSFPPAVTGA